nr:MAG TPA: hypothetical protein [Caudoviricetes sp.]
MFACNRPLRRLLFYRASGFGRRALYVKGLYRLNNPI